MGLLCFCPPATAISDITLVDCFEDFGQIQKLWFQRIYSTGTTKNSFTISTANPNVLASWSPLLAAADGTKVVQSPFLENPTGPTAGGPRTTGGGNASLGGVESVVGAEAATFEGWFYEQPQYVADQLKDYMCERNLGVYLIDQYGRIGGIADDNSSATLFYPIPIAPKTFFVGDKTFGNLEERDGNMIMFQLLPNWSDEFYVVTPTDFNPLDAQATS